MDTFPILVETGFIAYSCGRASANASPKWVPVDGSDLIMDQGREIGRQIDTHCEDITKTIHLGRRRRASNIRICLRLDPIAIGPPHGELVEIR